MNRPNLIWRDVTHGADLWIDETHHRSRVAAVRLRGDHVAAECLGVEADFRGEPAEAEARAWCEARAGRKR